MCGICGQLSFNKESPIDTLLIRRMCSTLKHRGPDNEGMFVDAHIGLGHSRLSVIDIEGGYQPMRNEDKTVWVVSNGEVYNFLELRNILEKKGHKFHSRSDTEVIVHLYEEEGTDCVKALRGMFAFALWDARNRSLLLARDRLGQKPLFYAHDHRGLTFASEMKALLQDPNLSQQVNLTSLHHFLTLQYVPGPQTIIQGINQLQPGHLLEYSGGQLKIKRYWEPNFLPKIELSKEEAAEEFRELLEESVRLRLVSDVPLGALLSGGIDSSMIVGLMSRVANKQVKTFSIGFSEEAFSELKHARVVAQHFGTDHTEIIVRPDILEMLPKLVWYLDQPLADPAAIPTYYLSKVARQQVTVALNGDGGDETCAGYQRYYADRIADIYAMVPSLIREKVINQVIKKFTGVSDKPLDSDLWGALARLHQAAALPREASIVRWGSYFSSDMKRALYSEELRARVGLQDSVELLRESFRRGHKRADHILDKTLYVDMLNYLPDDLLVKIDRTSMAHSLEVRSPFLDHKSVEFATRLPTSFKVRGVTTKYLLREVAKGIIPKKIITRRKQGFAVPIGAWLRRELKDMAYQTLLDPHALNRGYFKRSTIENILDEHSVGKVEHGKRIWALLCLELWHQTFVDGKGMDGYTHE